MYKSPIVNTPADNGALTPPPLVMAISTPVIFLIVSETTIPRGVRPSFLSWPKSLSRSATFSLNIGFNSASYFLTISAEVSSGIILALLE